MSEDNELEQIKLRKIQSDARTSRKYKVRGKPPAHPY